MIQDRDTGTIILCAIRYCFGRMTYMPSLVVDWCKRNWNDIDKTSRKLIHRDVKEEIESGRSLGMECDQQMWKVFLKWMEEKNE